MVGALSKVIVATCDSGFIGIRTRSRAVPMAGFLLLVLPVMLCILPGAAMIVVAPMTIVSVTVITDGEVL